MGSKSRRKWSSKEKLRIVMAGLDGGTEISELCRREGISATQYYNWKNQLVQSAEQVFGRSRGEAGSPPGTLGDGPCSGQGCDRRDHVGESGA